jgi:hypothetical protein
MSKYSYFTILQFFLYHKITLYYSLVEIKCVMAVVTQLYFQTVEEINYMFRPFSGWAIIRLKPEYSRNLTHYNVDYTSRMGERDLVLQFLGRCLAIYTRCGICASYNFVCHVFSRITQRG